MVTGIAAGACAVAANQPGNANYGAAPQATQTIAIGAASQSITFGAAPTVMVGGTGMLSATASSGLPVGFSSTTPAFCSVSGSTVTGVAAGSCVVAANQAGNANYSAAPQVTRTIAVGPARQTITFGAAPTLIVGGTGTLSATASSGLAVTFSSTTLALCTVSGATVTGVASGSCVVAANQPGTANYSAAPQVTQTIVVGPASQTITFGAAPTLTVGGTGTLSATASSGLAVTFSSTTPALCTASGSTITGVAAGSCVIAANQAGNANYSAAPQVTQTIAIVATGVSGLSPTTITFAAQQVGTTSATQSVTLANAGSVALTVGTITTSANFTHPASACGATLAPHSSCTINVAFAPRAARALTGTLTVGTNGTVSLTGTGVAPSVSLGTRLYAFGLVSVPTAATFTLSNTGTAPFVISSINMRAGTSFTVTGGTCSVAATVANGSSCTVTVLFSPLNTRFVADLLTVTGTGVGVGAPTYAATRVLVGQ